MKEHKDNDKDNDKDNKNNSLNTKGYNLKDENSNNLTSTRDFNSSLKLEKYIKNNKTKKFWFI